MRGVPYSVYSISLWLGASIRRWPAVHMKDGTCDYSVLGIPIICMTRAVTPDKSPFYSRIAVPLFRWPVPAANLRRDCTDSSDPKHFNMYCVVYGWFLKKTGWRAKAPMGNDPWTLVCSINHRHKELWQLPEGWINFAMFDNPGPCCVMSLFSLLRWVV